EEKFPVDSEAKSRLPSDLRNRLKVAGGRFYQGPDPSEPRVGDVRIEFRVTRPMTVSVIAKQVGDTFEPYPTQAGKGIELIKSGTHSAEAMFAAEMEANRGLTWGLRLVGFLLMAVGIFLVVRPLAVVMDVLPFLGDLTSLALGIMATLIALGLSLVTIAIAWVFYRPLVAVGLLAVGGGLFALLIYWRRKRRV